MYPFADGIIEYHATQEEPFNEWFAFLFEGNKWKLTGPITVPINHIEVSETKYRKTEQDFYDDEKGYHVLMKSFDYDKLGHITLVKPEDKYLIVDGYHRFYACDQHDLVNIEGCYEWIKTENNSPFALQIRELILNTL